MTNVVSITEIKSFLSKVNKNTYANKNAPKAKSSRFKSEDYHFEEGDLIYHDTYFGSKDFIGEEVIYKKEAPVWGANYFGFLLKEDLDKKKIYDFLRQALMQDYRGDIPVRGPSDFSFGDWTYQFLVKGDLGKFLGEEKILFKGNIVYRCFVHGGFVK